MKNKLIIFLALFSALIIISCEKEYVAPDTLSDATWAPGKLPSDLSARNLGESYSFRDASQGALTHEWTIQKGNYFLNAGFDPDTDSLELFINKDIGLTSTDHTVHVLLKNPGLNTIRLYNTFSEYVKYEGTDHTFEAVKQGDNWVIDTSFVVDVYKPIEPSFKVVKNGIEIINVKADDEIIPVEEWDTLTIEAGSNVDYVDLTTIGRPNGRTWNFGGGAPETSGDSVATISYYGLGSYYGVINSTRGGDYPKANAYKPIPLIIKVVPSTLPFVKVGTITEQPDELIAIGVSGECTDFSGEESNFTVHVSNGSFDQEISVRNAKVNPENKTQILLELSEAIYNTDLITVAYAGGNITSIDARTLQAFEADVVEMNYGESILPADQWGFENPRTDGNAGADIWWVQHEEWARTDDKAAVDNHSMRFQTADISTGTDFTVHGPQGQSGMPIKAGTYRMSMKVWFGAGSTLKQVRTNFAGVWKIVEWKIDQSITDQWQTIAQNVTFDVDNDNIKLQIKKGDAEGEAGAQLIYVDDIQAIPLEERP